jgi:hypothetical protein
MQRRRYARPFTMAVIGLVLMLVVVACGSQAAVGDDVDLRAVPDVGQPADGGEDAGEPTSGGTGDEAGGSGGPSGDGALFELIEQRIIKTGEITLEVDNVGAMLGRVRALVTELSGYVGGSQAGTLDDRATLTVRIPAESFETMLARLHELDAEVIAEATREEEVTTQIVDLQARIDNLQASEASYRQLLERAERIEDILAIQSRLDGVRGEIEQLQAQLDALEDRAALSTLTITLIPRAEPIVEQAQTWDPGAQLDRALASLVGIGQGLLDGLIWFAVVWLPVLLVLAIIALVVLRGILEVRRRMPASGGGVPPPATDRTNA